MDWGPVLSQLDVTEKESLFSTRWKRKQREHRCEFGESKLCSALAWAAFFPAYRRPYDGQYPGTATQRYLKYPATDHGWYFGLDFANEKCQKDG